MLLLGITETITVNFKVYFFFHLWRNWWLFSDTFKVWQVFLLMNGTLLIWAAIVLCEIIDVIVESRSWLRRPLHDWSLIMLVWLRKLLSKYFGRMEVFSAWLLAIFEVFHRLIDLGLLQVWRLINSEAVARFTFNLGFFIFHHEFNESFRRLHFFKVLRILNLLVREYFFIELLDVVSNEWPALDQWGYLCSFLRLGFFLDFPSTNWLIKVDVQDVPFWRQLGSGPQYLYLLFSIALNDLHQMVYIFLLELR